MFLSFHQTRLLRKYVNDETEYSYKYFATMTWSKQRQEQMRAKVVEAHPDWNENQIYRELQDWREKQTLSFLRFVARKQRTHFSVLLSFELHENPHAHVIVMSHKPIKRKLWNKEWRHGLQKWFEDYNPFIGRTENGVIGYVMGWGNRYSFPPKHRTKQGTYVFCPVRSSQCKNGNCQHSTHFEAKLHHVVNLSIQEERQMEQEWIEAGAWDLQEWKTKQDIRDQQSCVKSTTNRSTVDRSEKGLVGWRLRFNEIWDQLTQEGE